MKLITLIVAALVLSGCCKEWDGKGVVVNKRVENGNHYLTLKHPDVYYNDLYDIVAVSPEVYDQTTTDTIYVPLKPWH
jgi:PBP1b-binding outer membrane lipoprotein LpoB